MKMDRFKDIRAIAFDADDTLWALQEYFEEVEYEYCELLSEYGKRKKFLPLFWRRKVVIWLTWGMAARLSPFRW